MHLKTNIRSRILNLIALLSGIPLLVHSSGALVNISIDDTFANPSSDAQLFYGLTNQIARDGNGWTFGPNCSSCLSQPDPSQTFERSWHDTSTSGKGKNGDVPYASLSFTGVAVYVMGIIISSAPSTSNPLNNTRMFFQVDGIDQGNFTHFASVAPETLYSYNTTFFAMENLSNGQHNITIMCGDGNQSIASNCLLDRIIYTGAELANNTTSVIDSSTSISSATMGQAAPLASSDHKNLSRSSGHISATVISAIIGSLVTVALLAGVYIWRHYHRRRRELDNTRKFPSSNRFSTGLSSVSEISSSSRYSTTSYGDEATINRLDGQTIVDRNSRSMSYPEHAFEVAGTKGARWGT